MEAAWRCGNHLAGFTSKTPMAGSSGEVSLFFYVLKTDVRNKWTCIIHVGIVWLSFMPGVRGGRT